MPVRSTRRMSSCCASFCFRIHFRKAANVLMYQVHVIAYGMMIQGASRSERFRRLRSLTWNNGTEWQMCSRWSKILGANRRLESKFQEVHAPGKHPGRRIMHFFFFFPSHSFIMFALLFSLPPSRNSDPGSNSRLFFPPTHYGSCLAFLSREDFSSFFPVVTSTLEALSAVDPFLFLFLFANKFKISPRRDSNSRTNTSSIRGLPLVHRGNL